MLWCAGATRTGTGGAGTVQAAVLESSTVDIAKEFYLSLLVDRASGRVAFVVSTEGGMDIEQVAHDTPERIRTFAVDPATGFMPHHGRAVAAALGLDGDLAKQAGKVLAKLYEAFCGTDASQIEINPLAVTDKQELLVLDAKVAFDSNAEFRHPDLEQLRDLSEEEPMEIEASKHDLAYIKLDGNIGCMVNGAGLAMATMDIIKLAGGEPANFLDVGGGANAEQIRNAFKILMSDRNVKAVLINIFGGILRCDVLAQGVIAAVNHGRWPDHLIRVLGLVGYSVPVFWLGLMGLVLFLRSWLLMAFFVLLIRSFRESASPIEPTTRVSPLSWGVL